MRQINIKFLIREGSEPKKTWIYQILKDKFDVVLSENPDYIICQCYDKTMKYLNYDCIRILSTGENYVPDFNIVDYAICPYPVSYYDRCFRFPQCASGYMGGRIAIESRVDFGGQDILENKTRFANFIYSHESADGQRGRFFKLLSKYKKVDSAGSLFNNMTDGKCVHIEDGTKAAFQKSTKFTIAFESNVHEGFVTEKITDAFYAETIPIYYGDPYVAEIFNPKAFINCHDYNSLEEVVEKVKWLDTHDDEYLKMLNEPVFHSDSYLSELKKNYEDFILHIFEQPLEKARRRSGFAYPRVYNDYFRRMGNVVRPVERTKLFKWMLRATYNIRHGKIQN